MFYPLLALILLISPMTAATVSNDPVAHIDPKDFAGKWYSLRSIPTPFDKNWRETVETYTPRKKGGHDVFTTYRKVGEEKERSIKSILFPVKGKPDGELKAQFFWPIKVPYRILELTDTWMVGGAPDQKMLFILSREPSLPEETMEAIIERCRRRGYDVDKLQSQEHMP